MDQPTINTPSPNGEGEPTEMPSDITPPEPMGGRPPKDSKDTTTPSAPQPSQPLEMPKKPIGSYLIMILLIIILMIGGLFFASFKGWLSFGGLFGGKKTPSPSPTVTASPKTSPTISPAISPQVTTSPIVISNVNDETRKKDLANIKTALEKYYAANAKYPESPTVIKTSDSSNVLVESLAPTYLDILPDDPMAPEYYYGYKSDGETFELTCVLEDKSDSSGTLTGSYNIYKITDSSVE